MISIIIPCLNEADNIEELYIQIHTALRGKKYEVIFVNDGSTDNSNAVLEDITNEHAHVKALTHSVPLGKGQSLADGLKLATGDVVVFMDGDLQHDPAELPAFLAKIQGGFDCVNGIRSKRDDGFLITTYSKLANMFFRYVLGVPFRDINSGYKAFKREAVSDVPLYGNHFRFVLLAAYFKGYKIAEIPITNRSRVHGISKFGKGKIFIGFLDTITAYFIYRFSERPLHFFGAVGLTSFIIGFIVAFVLSFERVFFGTLLYRRPALLFAVLMMIVGIQILMTGFIGELVVYYNKKKSA